MQIAQVDDRLFQWNDGVVYFGLYPECHGSAPRVLLEGIWNAKMVKKKVSGTICILKKRCAIEANRVPYRQPHPHRTQCIP